MRKKINTKAYKLVRVSGKRITGSQRERVLGLRALKKKRTKQRKSKIGTLLLVGWLAANAGILLALAFTLLNHQIVIYGNKPASTQWADPCTLEVVECENEPLDPEMKELLDFVIECESNGNHNAIGAAGERGVLQYFPKTFQYLSQKYNFKGSINSVKDQKELFIKAVKGGDGKLWTCWHKYQYIN